MAAVLVLGANLASQFVGTPASGAASAPLTWAPPALVNPVVVNVTSGNQNLLLDTAHDYRLVLSSTPLTAAGGLVISGGHNVVLIGGDIEVPTAAQAPADNDRRGVYLKGQTGTIHIEGLHIGGVDLAEGFDLDERLGATVQLQNIRVDTVHGLFSGHHADVIQTWAGPGHLLIDGLTASTNYQGLFLLPHQLCSDCQVGTWDFRHVDITGTPEAGYSLWKEDGLAINLTEVHASHTDGAQNKLYWPNYAAWNGSSSVPVVQFVAADQAGIGYSSPGYVGVIPVPTTTTSTTSTVPATTTTAPATTTTTIHVPTTTTTTTTIPAPAPTTTTTTTTAPPVAVIPPSDTVPTPTPHPQPQPQPQVQGYWMVSRDGGVFTAGAAPSYGSAGGLHLNRPIVGMTATHSGDGYWLVASDGGVFSYNGAHFYGSTGNIRLNQPIVGMATTPSGHGYWMVASDGGIFSFGDARFFGSTGSIRLNKPIVGMAATADGGGYWLVASDGGIFSFGGAQFYGSTGSIRLNQPIVGMAATPSGHGYWMVASDGGIFNFGDAAFYGSGAGHVPGRVTGMASTASGQGYWIFTDSGWLGSFGDAQLYGAVGGHDIVGGAVVITG